MKKKFTYYTDPGHGYVKVPVSILRKLGIEKKIIHFSYWRKGYAYLEEDCDMATLIHNHPEKEKLEFVAYH